MPIKDVGFNPEVILRRFYKISVNCSENAILKKKSVKSPSRKNQRSFFFFFFFSDLVHHYIMQGTSKLKCVEKQLYRKQYVPNVFTIFLKKKKEIA